MLVWTGISRVRVHVTNKKRRRSPGDRRQRGANSRLPGATLPEPGKYLVGYDIKTGWIACGYY